VFGGSTSSVIFSGVGAILSYVDRFFKLSCILSTSIAKSLALSFFYLSSCSPITHAILLAMKSLNSFFFCSRAFSSSFFRI
jgi:uncharacterized membrane protein YobD (UPF0266 family)